MNPTYFGLANTTSLNLTIPSGSLSRYNSYNSYDQLIKILYECGKKKKVLSNIKKVIFSNPATIVLWNDGTKTVVKCGENETFDEFKARVYSCYSYQMGWMAQFSEFKEIF